MTSPLLLILCSRESCFSKGSQPMCIWYWPWSKPMTLNTSSNWPIKFLRWLYRLLPMSQPCLILTPFYPRYSTSINLFIRLHLVNIVCLMATPLPPPLLNRQILMFCVGTTVLPHWHHWCHSWQFVESSGT